MIYVKKLYKDKEEVLTFSNKEDMNKYIKEANLRRVKWYIYETEKSFKADLPDQLIFNISVKMK